MADLGSLGMFVSHPDPQTRNLRLPYGFDLGVTRIFMCPPTPDPNPQAINPKPYTQKA